MKLRLFIAFPLPTEVIAQLGEIIGQFHSLTRSVRWVKPDNIHLTVRFLGDTEEALVPRLADLLDQTARDFTSSSIVADRIGGFPNLKRPSVIWVGPSGPIEEAASIASAIESGVRELGLGEEKKGFKPHLTLGRVRRGQQIGELAEHLSNHQMKPIKIDLGRLVLFQSTLTPSGPIYKRLAEAHLRTPG